MAPDRRTFLKLAGGACLIPGWPAAWWEARELVRGGSLGRVVFGRASWSTEEWLPFLCGGATPIWERSAGDEVVLCGTEATLVVDRRGYRRFA
jgi:predicted dehydrogenase